MATGNLSHLLRFFTSEPLCITQEALSIMNQYLIDRSLTDLLASSGSLSEDLKVTQTQSEESELYDIITISGVLTQKASYMDSLCGMCSYEDIQRQVKTITNNGKPFVIIDFDTPGGMANGCKTTAESLKSLSENKETISFISGECCSAGLWLATASDHVIAAESITTVGSVGAIINHCSRQRLEENVGLKFTSIRSGEEKARFGPHEDLTESDLKQLQDHVDSCAEAFVSTIFMNRPQLKDHEKEIRTGKLFMAKDAIKIGMIDSIRSFDSIINDLR